MTIFFFLEAAFDLVETKMNSEIAILWFEVADEITEEKVDRHVNDLLKRYSLILQTFLHLPKKPRVHERSPPSPSPIQPFIYFLPIYLTILDISHI